MFGASATTLQRKAKEERQALNLSVATIATKVEGSFIRLKEGVGGDLNRVATTMLARLEKRKDDIPLSSAQDDVPEVPYRLGDIGPNNEWPIL